MRGCDRWSRSRGVVSRWLATSVAGSEVSDPSTWPKKRGERHYSSSLEGRRLCTSVFALYKYGTSSP